MRTKEILSLVMTELTDTFSSLEEEQLDLLQAGILKANRIFVAGAGRSLMMIRGFAMRLMHMGFDVYVVGETVTPAIEKGDLLLVASGSGSTGSLTVMSEKCKRIGAKLALITTRAASPIGILADIVLEVNATTTKAEDKKNNSIQPGANTFEQSVLLIGDAIIIHMMSKRSLAESNQELMARHANLE